MLFKTIWESKMEANIVLNLAKIEPGAFQDALAARLSLGVVLGSPRNLENRALAVARCYFLLKSPTAPGGPKSTPIWSKIEAKRWGLKP